ncbi:arginine decarboxylase [Neobacillus piezotolerans]|uniref:Arginine decarboxylase n=1 Tax=Neobacillus piezotolerans TaxID=2259171 RepID=A0A3D8GKF8_9BACI|nr:aminotransferase class V-fold PLP-dependent enzyme [Neobacillus piezotolerans]RDU34821.1 arginine decarboxylase [Neobacillus piezotolerans]
MNQQNSPIYNALMEHAKKNPVSFHVPGHKYGSVQNIIGGAFFEEILKLDATELSGLDDLHSPEGVIADGALLLAKLYGVQESFFLVNGSTVGNLTMILSVCGEGDKILVQRNCHKSIINALRLAKADPVFIEPIFNGDWKVAGGLDTEAAKRAIVRFPDLKAIVLTYPNYYGIADPIAEIIEVAHQNGIPVLVDEAHGAHFIAAEGFPVSAVALGADLVVHSAHKTLPAMTMGSFLHFNSGLVNLGRVKDYLQVLQSSSPSYPLLASLDLARAYLGTFNRRDFAILFKKIQQFREELDQIPQIRVLTEEGKTDPLKVVIQSACRLNGFEIQQLLEHEGIFTELADPSNVLFVLPLLKEGMPYPFLNTVKKIKELLYDYAPVQKETDESSRGGDLSQLALSYRMMDSLQIQPVKLENAKGMIMAETIVPYPPGIPLLLKGERISEPVLRRLTQLIQSGSRFQGGERLKDGEILIYR